MTKSDPLRIFVHVPKCGGTTVNHVLSSGLAPGQMLPLHYSRLGEVRRSGDQLFTKRDADEYVGNLSAEAKSKIRMIGGHLAYYGIHRFFDRPAQYILFFRDPLKRAVSHYRFLCKRLAQGGFLTQDQKAGLVTSSGSAADFTSWLKNNPAYHNYMTRFFFSIPEQQPVDVDGHSVEKIQQEYETAWIGLTESLDRDLAYLTWGWASPSQKWERKNVSSAAEEVRMDQPDELIQKYFQWDWKLYEWAIHRHRAFVRSHWDYFPKAYWMKSRAEKSASPKK